MVVPVIKALLKDNKNTSVPLTFDGNAQYWLAVKRNPRHYDDDSNNAFF